MANETTPAAEVSPASIEAKLAAAFERAGMRDDPEPPEPVEADESEVDDAPNEESDDPEAEAQPDEAGETTGDDGEEVEYEGKAYKLPKPLKDALLRQQDYTKKTQQVAELRKITEERAQNVQAESEFQQANFDKVVQAHALHSQLQQFASVNFAELAETNPQRYLMLDRQQRQLQDALNRVNGEIQQAASEFQGKRSQAKQKAQAQCIEALKKDFKDFGPDLLNRLDDTGKSFGFSGEELASIVDPRMVRVLHAAMQYKKLQGSKTLVDKKVQEARPVQVKSARSAQTSQANAQIQTAKAQMRKTGKTADVETFLAARFAKAMR
jgi:hypothetical protein